MRQCEVGKMGEARTLLLVCDTLDVESVSIGGIEVSARARYGLDGLHARQDCARKCESGCGERTHS